MTAPNLLSPGAAANVLGVNTSTIARYLDLGLLEGHTLPSGQRRITAESLEAVLSKRNRLSSTVTIIEAG